MEYAILGGLAIGLSLLMTLAWLVQRLTGSSGWVDTIWSFAVGIGGIAAVVLADGTAERRTMAGLLIALWALRLGGHIGLRTRGAGEDPRYEALIREWGDAAAWRLWLFLQVQALAAFVLVLAVYVAAAGKQPFPVSLDVIGLAVGLAALAGEALADHQLSRFRKSPQARQAVMEEGLWAYSRHPNYFFEWMFWCAWFVIAAGSGEWTSLLTLLAPVQMYWLLVHVSGIPPLEEHMLRSRGDAFRDLQSRVNAFFPGPRHGAASPVSASASEEIHR